MAIEVGIRELKNHASSLIREVESKGEIVTITKRGKPVARIIPAGTPAGIAKMIAEGKIGWSGRKPTLPRPVKLRGKGKSISEYIVEERDRHR